MKAIDIDIERDFAALCQSVANTGQAVVITRDLQPLVSIVPLSRSEAPAECSIWELRRQFDQSCGPLREDFAPPPRHLDEAHWADPFKD